MSWIECKYCLSLFAKIGEGGVPKLLEPFKLSLNFRLREGSSVSLKLSVWRVLNI